MSFDLVQSVAYMALAAGGASDILDTQANLIGDLQVFLEGGTAPDQSSYAGFFPTYNGQLDGGAWSVVWGPAVVTPTPDSANFASNSMYVACNAAQTTYVVAVAGTDFESLYDWFDEDADVAEADMVTWPLGSPPSTAAKISGATNTGLGNLTSMVNADGVALGDYLDSVANTGATLIFTGHSLGGALSPTLALALYADPGLSSWGTVYVLPLAGPTPGNKAFADIFNGAYRPASTGSDTYPSWNCNYQNFRDMVPRAWNRLQSIAPLPDGKWFYGSIWGMLDSAMQMGVQAVIEKAQKLVSGAGYWRVNPQMFGSEATWGYFVPGPTSPAEGGWTTPVWNSWPLYGVTNPITSDTVLEPLVVSSHLDQYYRFFGLLPLEPLPQSDGQAAAAQVAKLKREMAIAAAKVSVGARPSAANYRPAEEAEDRDDPRSTPMA